MGINMSGGGGGSDDAGEDYGSQSCGCDNCDCPDNNDIGRNGSGKAVVVWRLRQR